MMKKILYTFIIFICALTFLYSQPQSKIRWGIKTGINYSHVSGTQNGDVYSSVSSMIGVFIRHRLSDNFEIMPELLYTAKGTAKDIIIENKKIIFSFTLRYIEIPILLNYKIPVAENSPVVPNIFLGPAFAIKTSATLTGEYLGYSDDEKLPGIKSFDYSFIFGTGLFVKIGKENELGFELRYTLGFVKYDIVDDFLGVKNRTFSIYFGYTF